MSATQTPISRRGLKGSAPSEALIPVVKIRISAKNSHLLRIRLHHVKCGQILKAKIHGRIGIHSDKLLLQA